MVIKVRNSEILRPIKIAKSILIIDKEPKLGLHSSGLNSGVLHAGLYYEPKSLKAKVCVSGARRLKNWVKERQAVVKDGGMPPVWEMTKALWFNDDFVARENADYCRIRDVFVKTPVAGYLGGTSAVADLAYRDKLHLIQAPTRIIAAGDDPVTPIQKSKEIRSEISNSELVIIDGQRHFSNVEVPETFNNELIRCLDQIV